MLSTPTSTSPLRSLIMDNISLCTIQPAHNQQLSVLTLSLKQNPTLIVSTTTTSHCRRGQMSYQHIQYGFCLYYFLLLCPSLVFQNQIEKNCQQDICFVYNHFIEKVFKRAAIVVVMIFPLFQLLPKTELI